MNAIDEQAVPVRQDAFTHEYAEWFDPRLPLVAPADLADDKLPLLIDMIKADIADRPDPRTAYANALREEIAGRLTERGAKSLPSKTHVVELEDQYTPYAFDLERLKEAAQLLPDDEAAKVVKHRPAYTVPAHIVPETWTAGAAVSITALINRYGESSDIGKALAAGMSRTVTDQRLVIKPRKAVR